MDTRIIIGQIARYEPTTGKYYVKYNSMAGDPIKGLPAMLTSPIPFIDGGGIKAAPKVPIDTPCLLYNAGSKWVIIGFLSPEGLVVQDTHYPAPRVEPGDMYISHNTGSRFGINSIGTFVAWVNGWANVALNPLKKQLTAFFKNLAINFYAGYIQYKYDDQKKSSSLTIQVSKELELASVVPGEIQKDRVNIQLGKILDDDHVVDLVAKQEFDTSRLPKFLARLKIGKQKNNVVTELSNTYDKDIITKLTIDSTGKLDYNSTNKKIENSIILKSDPKGEPLHITFNKDKTEIIIDKDGNVTIKTTPDAKIKLGGTGKEQELVTKSFIETFYKNHIHSNGNMGAPTGPPLTPVISVGSDSSSSPLTFTTLAE